MNCCVTIALALFLVSAAARADDRPTRALTLDNELRVLLVSDPDADRAGASLAVGIGAMADGEHPGIAHFLEHMLFLGTEKYPEPGEYKSYLAANDGSSNAYTAEDHTNYFFQVKPDAYRGALDRFSQFFVAPLLTDTLSGREVNAVDSEHSKNLEDDFWRRRQVFRSLLNPEHPRNTFSTGSKKTLAGVRNEVLRAFHDRHYSANRMALAMVAPQPLDTLEQWARELFSAVPNKELAPFTTDVPLFGDLAGKRVDVKSVKDIRELRLHFELDEASFDMKAKPARILADIVGHEGAESLLQELKSRGWATGLSAGPPRVGQTGTFDVTVQLTAEGLERVESVAERVFAMLNLLRSTEELPDYLLEEAQDMQELHLRFRQPGDAMNEVRTLGREMMTHPHENLLEHVYLIPEPSQAKLRHVLDQLRPERSCMFVNARSVATDRTEEHYGAEYAVRPLPAELLKRFATAKASGDMGLPAPNPFLPKDFSLVATRHAEEPFVHDFRKGEVWLRHDVQFEQPKASAKFEVLNGLHQESARDFVLGQLFAAAATEAYTPHGYPAALAGLAAKFTSERGGLALEVGGYSDRLPDLVASAAPFLTELRIDEATFEILKEKRLRELRNKVKQPASQHAFDLVRDVLREVHWNDAELLAALEPVTFGDLKDYVTRSREATYLRGFVYGNLEPAQVRQLSRTLRGALGGRGVLPEEKRFRSRVLKMAAGTSAILRKEIDSNDSACVLLYQGDPLSDRDRAVVRVAGQMVSNTFFQDLRTLQQTGYIVGAAAVDTDGLPLFYFLSQSSVVDTASLRGRFQAFVKHFVDDLKELEPEEFDRQREAAIARVLKKRTTYAEELAWNYEAAFDRKGDFEAEQREAAALRALTVEEFRAALPAYFADETARRVSIEVLGASDRHRFQPMSLEELRESAEGYWERPARQDADEPMDPS